MIQLDNLVELKETVAPPQLYRYNRFNSATVSAGLAPRRYNWCGFGWDGSYCKKKLSTTVSVLHSGWLKKDFRESSSSLLFAFCVGIGTYLFDLAAHSESFKDPFVIMFTVPLAVAGALVFMYFGNITMNIFSQIGIIMLIGLVAKNGFWLWNLPISDRRMELIKIGYYRTSGAAFTPDFNDKFSTILGLLPLAFASAEVLTAGGHGWQ